MFGTAQAKSTPATSSGESHNLIDFLAEKLQNRLSGWIIILIRSAFQKSTLWEDAGGNMGILADLLVQSFVICGFSYLEVVVVI